MLRTYLFATSLRVVLLPSPPASCERAGRGPPTLPLSSSLFPRKHQERSRVLAPGRRDGPDSSSPRFGCPPPPPAAQHHGRRPAAPRPAIVSRTHPRRAPEASSQRSAAQPAPAPATPAVQGSLSRDPIPSVPTRLGHQSLSFALSLCALSRLTSPHLTSRTRLEPVLDRALHGELQPIPGGICLAINLPPPAPPRQEQQRQPHRVAAAADVEAALPPPPAPSPPTTIPSSATTIDHCDSTCPSACRAPAPAPRRHALSLRQPAKIGARSPSPNPSGQNPGRQIRTPPSLACRHGHTHAQLVSPCRPCRPSHKNFQFKNNETQTQRQWLLRTTTRPGPTTMPSPPPPLQLLLLLLLLDSSPRLNLLLFLPSQPMRRQQGLRL